MPKENFDPLVEADFMAYQKVIPNFQFGGHWFSKERFGLCTLNGHRYPFETAEKRIVKNPQSEPAETADPCDWEVLQPEYEYWRNRYLAQGYTHMRYEVFLGRQ